MKKIEEGGEEGDEEDNLFTSRALKILSALLASVRFKTEGKKIQKN